MRRDFLYIIIFAIAGLLDRITKFFAIGLNKPVYICKNISLSFTMNRGVTWGMFNQASSFGFFLLAFLIAIVITFFLIYTVIEYKSGNLISFELLVLAGAISNFFDRIYYGAVIDFIDIHLNSWHWPTFNLADAFIVVGAVGIVWRSLCVSRKT